MKSVTIKRGKTLILKVLHRKDGKYELLKSAELSDISIDVRDDKGCKVMFGGGQS